MDLMSAFEQAARHVAMWELDAAVALLRRIHDEHPETAPRTLTELAVALSLQGRGQEALVLIEQAVALAPRDATILQNQLILEKLREPEDPARFLVLHRAWGNTFTPAGGCLHLARFQSRRSRADGPLRVAYVGVDAHTALTRFLPILAEHHDPSRVSLLFCHGLADTTALAAARSRWPHIHHLGSRALSARQYARALAHLDVDIAVDLSGHGHGGTLQALAYHPAPIQLTWLDYVATTGVPAIDGRIADAVSDPDDRFSTEVVHRLPFAQWCALPPKRGAMGDRRSNDTPVIGLINVTVKLSPRLLGLAVRILEGHDSARLMMLGLTGDQARSHVLAHIPPALHDRLDLHDRVDETTYHALVATVDLAIDPTVFSGATSTLDALFAGIPVLTVPGDLPHTRSSASILATLGLDEWIARDDDNLVAMAVAMLSDEAALRHWRSTLPAKVAASTLADGAAFVAGLEALYRSVWQALPDVGDDVRAALVQRVNSGIAAGDPQQVIYALEALTLDGASPKLLLTLATAYNQLGVSWLKRGGRFEARRQFEMALEIAPDLAEARHNLAMIV